MTNKKSKKETATTSSSPSKKKPSSSSSSKKKKLGFSTGALEIPYTYPSYSGGTGLTDASDVYAEMQKIVQEKTEADPTCWNGITLVSLNFSDGPHFASTRDMIAAAQQQDAAAAAAGQSGGQQQQGNNAPEDDPNFIRDTTTSVHVSGIPSHSSEQELRICFSDYSIKNITIPPHPKKVGVHRGYAFVEFVDQKTADLVKGMPAGTFTVSGVPVRVTGMGAGGRGANNATGGEDDDDNNDDGAANNNNSNNANNNRTTAEDPNASRVAAINNLVPEGAEIDESLVDALVKDCSKYGEIKNIAFFKAGDDDDASSSSSGPTAAVEFATHSEAAACVQKMNGRTFDRRILTSGLLDMELYKVVAQS